MPLTDKELKRLLNLYYAKYNNCYSSADPVWNMKKVKSDLDKEVLAFIISCYCYGNIVQINKFIDKVLNLTTFDISYYILSLKNAKGVVYNDFSYRFNNNYDFKNLIFAISKILNKYGSLKSLFLKYYNESDENVIKALDGFTSEIRTIAKGSKSFEYLVPDLNRKSACKRLFLFLRWMVRKDNVDLGLWNNDIHASKLLIPVDTHVYNISRKYGLINRKSLDLKFAVELTEKLKEFDPNDPVKFDFALCHLGVDKVNI